MPFRPLGTKTHSMRRVAEKPIYVGIGEHRLLSEQLRAGSGLIYFVYKRIIHAYRKIAGSCGQSKGGYTKHYRTRQEVE